jgi:hypothetical protein
MVPIWIGRAAPAFPYKALFLYELSANGINPLLISVFLAE